jgi:hypothetical protein
MYSPATVRGYLGGLPGPEQFDQRSIVTFAPGVDATANSPEQHAAFLREEYTKWGRLIAEAGIRAE